MTKIVNVSWKTLTTPLPETWVDDPSVGAAFKNHMKKMEDAWINAIFKGSPTPMQFIDQYTAEILARDACILRIRAVGEINGISEAHACKRHVTDVVIPWLRENALPHMRTNLDTICFKNADDAMVALLRFK